MDDSRIIIILICTTFVESKLIFKWKYPTKTVHFTLYNHLHCSIY